METKLDGALYRHWLSRGFPAPLLWHLASSGAAGFVTAWPRQSGRPAAACWGAHHPAWPPQYTGRLQFGHGSQELLLNPQPAWHTGLLRVWVARVQYVEASACICDERGLSVPEAALAASIKHSPACPSLLNKLISRQQHMQRFPSAQGAAHHPRGALSPAKAVCPALLAAPYAAAATASAAVVHRPAACRGPPHALLHAGGCLHVRRVACVVLEAALQRLSSNTQPALRRWTGLPAHCSTCGEPRHAASPSSIATAVTTGNSSKARQQREAQPAV